MRLFAALLLSVALVSSLTAQSPKPGPEHDVLKKLVGTWETTMKIGGQESKGIVTYKMELGGLWLGGEMNAEMFGEKFTGKSLETYDATKKKYVSLWCDSMSTTPVTMEGTYDATKKTFSLTGEGPGMDGKPQKYKSETVMTDDDTFTMTMQMGEDKANSFVVVYKRKK